MLELRNYSVDIIGKTIIDRLNYTFENGKTYAILGENGSGKSSLAFSFLGHPRYHTTGQLLLSGVDISEMDPHERSEKGIFLSFQNVPEIPGITLIEYLKTIYNTHQKFKNPLTKPLTTLLFRRILTKLFGELGIETTFLDRDLYVWFSGGEKRRIELLQIRLLDPDTIILDEIDSGLDIGAIDILITEITSLQEKWKTIILITHNFHLLDALHIDGACILEAGNIREQWGKELIDQVRTSGF